MTANLNDGNVQIDNYRIENTMRTWAVGRKAWLLAGSEPAGQRAAVVMNLVYSVKLKMHDPWAYPQERADAAADPHEQPHRGVAATSLATDGLRSAPASAHAPVSASRMVRLAAYASRTV